MDLTKHETNHGPRWAVDGRLLPDDFSLGSLLGLSASEARRSLEALEKGAPISAPCLAPIDDEQEVWASGVTYLSSRMAREAESQNKDVYQTVYEATRPELFFKAIGWRVRGPSQTIRVRADSSWNVPEPELTLVITSSGEILGYTIGNDVSSRSIEGENPLYLPQAKIYNQSCALGPWIRVVDPASLTRLPIRLQIEREGRLVFDEETNTARIKRSFSELVEHLLRELDQPRGVFLMSGTGIVPPESFTLRSSDLVRIDIDGLVLENPVL